MMKRWALFTLMAVTGTLLLTSFTAPAGTIVCPDQPVTCPSGYEKIYTSSGPCCENSEAGCCQYQCGDVVCYDPQTHFSFYAGFERINGVLRDKGRWCLDNTQIPGYCEEW